MVDRLVESEGVLIVGTGAMACLFAARLGATGVPVTMLGTWKEGLDTLKSKGVCLVNEDGSESFFCVKTISEKEIITDVKLALILVKSWQTERSAQRLLDCMASDGLVLTLQNGLGNQEILGDVLGEERVAVGITTLGATLLGPARVRAGGEGKISLERHPKIEDFVYIFHIAGFDVNVSDNLENLIWGKLLVNSAINPLTALLQIPNGDLLKDDSCRTLMGLITEETAAVAKAIGIDLPYDYPTAIVESVALRTASNYSSMFQDIQRGERTEIDAICGAVVQIGKRIGFPTPLNQLLWLLVKAAANNRKTTKE